MGVEHEAAAATGSGEASQHAGAAWLRLQNLRREADGFERRGNKPGDLAFAGRAGRERGIDGIDLHQAHQRGLGVGGVDFHS